MSSEVGIIDNRDVKFIDKFKSFCKHTKDLKIASGYFYVSGFDVVKDNLADITKIRVVMGNETDPETAQQIEQGYVEKVKEVLVGDLQKITGDNGQKIEALKDLHDYIKAGKIEVKVYVTEKFHAKAYIFERKDDSIGDIAIVGSSNFSRAGLGVEGKQGNTELNSIHKNDNDLVALKRWYEKIWDEAKPFEKDLLNIIETSQPYVQFVLGDKEYVTPFELFKTLVFEFLNHDVAAFKEVLAEFQKIGVINAKQKINDFNGCIISDSVGLGKTLVGAGLIQDFQREGKNVLLVVPASVKDNWKRELTRTDRKRNRFFDIDMDEDRLKIVTITELSRINLGDEKDQARIDSMKNNYSVIVIDEAHRFRNAGSYDPEGAYSGNKNYANLQALRTTDKKYVLLTATPLNNSINDLANLTSIFTNAMILKNKNSLLDFGHFEEYGRLTRKMRELEKQGKIDSQAKSNMQFELSKHLEGITRILEEVMILRTRSDISERYPDLIIDGKKISFKMAKINREKYDFPKTYLPIYEHITDFLANLHVPHIALINETAGVTLAGLYRMLLFKRLESSIYSFVKSLDGLREKEHEFLKEIKQDGWDATRKRRKKDANYNKEAVDGDIELTEWLEEQGSEQQTQDHQSPDEVTQEQVIKMIQDDLEMIDTFYNRFIPLIRQGKYNYDDTKLTKLKEILSKISGQKVLIFTQYIDTVDYIYNNLKEYAKVHNLKLDCVVGETIDEESDYGSDLPREKKIKLFSPISNGYKLDEDEREIDILISTDALAEGVNLQDCSIVVDYDLPWNPMRIVQRIGRVDRIGSTQRATVYNIFPDKELDTLLELIEKLRTKIANITRIIGKESYILSDDDEEINPRVIGEKIKELEQTTDFATYESEGRNPLLRGVKGGEERSAKVLELKSLVGRLKIQPTDFKEYNRVIYSITSGETKKGLFAMFRIFDISRGDGIESKMEDVLLFKDFRTCDIQPIDISDLHLEDAQEGIRKSNSSIKYDLEKSLKELENYFEKTIYQERKSGFKKAKMRIKAKPTRLQRYVVTRLSKVAFNTQLSSKTLDSSQEKAKVLLKEFKEKVLDQKTSDSMKNHYASSVSKDVTTVIQSLERMKNEEFVRKTQNFYDNYVRDNPSFARLRDEKDVKYRIICWGALV